MRLLADLVQVYIVILFVRVIFSWVFPQGARGGWHEVERVVYLLTEPMLSPVRRVLPVLRVGGVGIDLSIFVVILVLQIVRSWL